MNEESVCLPAAGFPAPSYLLNLRLRPQGQRTVDDSICSRHLLHLSGDGRVASNLGELPP